MPSQKTDMKHASFVASLMTAMVLLMTAVPASASPQMGGPHGTPMDRDYHPGMNYGMHYGMRANRPHNAAEHFLQMRSSLDLTDDQVKKLTTLRDDYITKNSTAEQQLNAAYDDLRRTLYADDVDLNAANTMIDKIGKLEPQLWRAFAQQMHDIRAMLTADQKKALNDLSRDYYPHMMRGVVPGDMPMNPSDDMPMRPGDMPMHRGMW